MTAYGRKVEALERDLEDGTIDVREFDEEMAMLDREARCALREQAEEAYEDVMEGWL